MNAIVADAGSMVDARTGVLDARTLAGGNDSKAPDNMGSGLFSRLMSSGGDLGSLRTADVLRPNEWITYDNTVVEIARGQFSLVSDLMGLGLTQTITNPLGTMMIQWDRVGGLDDAEWAMTPEITDRRSRLNFQSDAMPIPLIHHGFKLDIRHLLAARQHGTQLDTSHARAATLRVVEGIEKMFLNGSYSAGANSGAVYGLTAYPYRNTGALTRAWNNSITTGDEIFADVNAMIAALEAKNQYGPYGIYIPKEYAQVMRRDYDKTTNKGRTILARLMEIESIKFIKTNQFLAANNVVCIQLTKDTIEVMDGFQPMMVQWSDGGGWVTYYKIIAIMLPRCKRDALDQNGIAHFIV